MLGGDIRALRQTESGCQEVRKAGSGPADRMPPFSGCMRGGAGAASHLAVGGAQGTSWQSRRRPWALPAGGRGSSGRGPMSMAPVGVAHGYGSVGVAPAALPRRALPRFPPHCGSSPSRHASELTADSRTSPPQLMCQERPARRPREPLEASRNPRPLSDPPPGKPPPPAQTDSVPPCLPRRLPQRPQHQAAWPWLAVPASITR